MNSFPRLASRACAVACALSAGSVVCLTPSRAADAATLHAAMGVGINYGNHFENKQNKTVEAMPVIAREKFRTIKQHGFGHVRLPVCWGWRLRQPWAGANVAATIDDTFMSRVKQSVDNALAEGLVVVLNTHHEDWFQRYYTKENNARIRLNSTGTDYYAASEADDGRPAMEIYKDIWRDIVANFDGDPKYENLIFEGLNEPRITDSSGIGSFTNAQVNTVNQVIFNLLQDNLNQDQPRVYMMTVNDANNARSFKHLTIPTRGGWSAGAVKAQLIVTIHYYHTYAWTHDETVSPGTWGTATDYLDLTDRFGDITPDSSSKFSNGSSALVGVKVNIGEFGVRHRRNDPSQATNRNPADVLKWYRVVAAAAEKRGMTYTVWDDNGWFRVFNRNDGTYGSFDWGSTYESEVWKMATLFKNSWNLTSGLNAGWNLAASGGGTGWLAWELKAESATDALQRFQFQVDPGEKIASLEDEIRHPALRNAGSGKFMDVASESSPANGRAIRNRDDPLDSNLDHYVSLDYEGSGAFSLAIPLTPLPASGRWVVDLPASAGLGSDAVLGAFATGATDQCWILERAGD